MLNPFINSPVAELRIIFEVNRLNMEGILDSLSFATLTDAERDLLSNKLEELYSDNSKISKRFLKAG